MKALLLILLLTCAAVADTPVKTTYAIPVTRFETLEHDMRVEVTVEVRTTIDLSEVRDTRWSTERANHLSLYSGQARNLYRALGRALVRLDSLETAHGPVSTRRDTFVVKPLRRK